jgi:hypothetical protein
MWSILLHIIYRGAAHYLLHMQAEVHVSGYCMHHVILQPRQQVVLLSEA